ncbi:MAG: hypothetical protein K2H48_06655 [Duncaniella sp.]|nr:hypothetical protein [Duncaniella sp.]
MTKTRFGLILLLTFFVSNFCLADGESTATSYSNILVRVPKSPGNNRPKAPDMQSIICTYDGTCITLSFALPEGRCESTVTDMATGLIYSYVFDTSDLYIELEIPEIKSFDIEIITEKGNTYTGSISIE